MYTEIESHSTHLEISKAALIRLAIEEYFRNLDADKSVETDSRSPMKLHGIINTSDIRETKEPVA